MAETEKGTHNMEISDSDKRMDALADMIRDACRMMDEGSKRMDARMDAMEAKMSDRKDAEKEEGDKREDADKEVKEEGAPKEVAAGRNDSEEDVRRAASETKVDRKDSAKKDEDDEAMADAAPTRADFLALQQEIARLQSRAPTILADADRERFAAIQERADTAFQAFGDRAPAPLDGETPTQYKRRIGTKLQAHSPKWKDTRLSAIADDATIDVILDDVYADSLMAARRGAAVPAGHLREVKSRNDAGHTFISFEGSPSSWMRPLAGRAQAARGSWKTN